MTRSGYVVLAILIAVIVAGIYLPVGKYVYAAKDSYGREQIKTIGMLQEVRFGNFGEYYTDQGALKSDSRIDTRKCLLILTEADIPPTVHLPADKHPYLKTDGFRVVVVNLNDDGSPRSLWVLDSSKELSHYILSSSK